MRTAKNRILSSITRLNSAERSLTYLLEKRGANDEKGKTFDIKSALYEIRNARTLIKNIKIEETTTTRLTP